MGTAETPSPRSSAVRFAMNEDEERERNSYLKPLSDRDFQYISDLVYGYTGINLHEGKRELVRTRLCRRLRELGMDTFAEYCAHLAKSSSAGEVSILIDTVSTNLTSFFREDSHFEFLRRKLPEMFRQIVSRFRIWSTACSTGEEAYSLAIVLAEALATHPRLDAKILATDISGQVLRHAEAGVYPKERVNSVPPNLRVKYFQILQDDRYEVAPALRHLVSFRKLNVTGIWPFQGPFDIVFCRNMMIYFDKGTQAKLIQRFHDILRPGGYLFVGHSESLVSVSHSFKYVEPTIYQKV